MSSKSRSKESLTGKGTINFGEVVGFAPDASRWTALGIIQSGVALFLFATFICTLLETQYVRYMNVYIYTITYGVVGVLLIVVAQVIAFLIYMMGNKMPVKACEQGSNYMGQHHTREITVGLVVSILTFIVNVWQLINYLSRFDKTCCVPATKSDPDTANPIEWRVFYGTMVINTVTAFVAVLFLVRTICAHFNPLRSATNILLNPKNQN